MPEIFTAIMLLIATAGTMFLYIKWIDQENRSAPENRSLVGRAIIDTWRAVRTGVEWAFHKVGITTRT